MNKIDLSIGGMSCSACSSGLEKYLNKKKGIVDASVNLVLAMATIKYEGIGINDIERYIKEAGFESLGPYDLFKEKKNKNIKRNLIIYSVLVLILLYVSMSHMIGLPIIDFLNMENYANNYSICLLVLTIPFMIYGLDIFKGGYKNLIHKTPNMDTLVSIGVLSSFIYSLFSSIMIILDKDMFVHNLYYESAGVVIYFIKLGRYIDSKSKEKTKEAIKSLVQITPMKALVKTKDGEKEVTIDEVKVGDILICKPGMKFAVDGIIVDASTHADESFITGESKPNKKTISDKVVAGSLNIDGSVLYEAKAIGKNSTISEIVRLVVEASNTKAPIARFADRVSGYFVPSIILIAVITFISYLLLGKGINNSLVHFVNVLVVSCPCALGLATPLAIVVSEGVCAKNGILVKNSETLENSYKVDTICFDKTGTLTYGNLKVNKINNYSDYKDTELKVIISSLESKSSHPIASAFKDEKFKLKDVKNYKNIDGVGLEGKIEYNKYYVGNARLFEKLKIENKYSDDENELTNDGNSILYVIENKKVIALVGVKDIIRDDAKKIISELNTGREVIMLTGDNEVTANVIAKELNINNVISNVLPSEKVKEIKNLMEENTVMMIGDGINDAPSLATSSIGVSIGSGTDIANDSSDVILMNDNLVNIVNLINISKSTIKIIKENLFWAFFYNICMIPISIGLLSRFGINMNPMIAGLSMTLSSVTVMLNTLRLKRVKVRKC